MDDFCDVVKDKIHIIDKPKKRRSKLGMNIISPDANDSSPFLCFDYVQQALSRFLLLFLIAERLYGVLFVNALGRNTVGCRRAGREFAVGDADPDDPGSGGC